MIKKGGDLRDLEFRQYLVRNIGVVMSFDIRNEFYFLNKEEVTDRDLLEFYFKYFKLKSKLVISDEEINKILFNYKLEKISKEEKANFFAIVKNKIGVTLNGNWVYEYYSFKTVVVNAMIGVDVFYELVDIFLDEV